MPRRMAAPRQAECMRLFKRLTPMIRGERTERVSYRLWQGTILVLRVDWVRGVC
jgi:hypothetical protein